MQEKKAVKIMIPEGYFEGYCDSCFYGKRKDKDAEGKIRCTGEPGGYKFPYEKNNCGHYASRIFTWIKILVFSYFVIAVLVGIIQLLM